MRALKIPAALLPLFGEGDGLRPKRPVVWFHVPEHVEHAPGDLVQVGLD
jgi:hypothetical protein